MMPGKARRTLNVYQPCIRSQINQGFLYVQRIQFYRSTIDLGPFY